MHRITYISERSEYYLRQEKARGFPNEFYSDIADGMASCKTKVPHFADSYDFSEPLNMHLQAVLTHGRHLGIFLLFNNLKCDSNLANYCWLQSLEDIYGKDGKLPDVLYHQVDGAAKILQRPLWHYVSSWSRRG